MRADTATAAVTTPQQAVARCATSAQDLCVLTACAIASDMGTQKRTKKITVCAMAAALGTTILYLGSFIEVLDISMAVLASVLCVIMVIEYGKGAPWSVFLVTSLLSLLLLPNKFPALLYTLFFGYYPIIKEKIEKIPSRILSWAIKLVIFAAATGLLFLLTTIFTVDVEIPAGTIMKSVFVVLIALTLILYDLAMTRIISFYIIRLRQRFKKIF